MLKEHNLFSMQSKHNQEVLFFLVIMGRPMYTGDAEEHTELHTYLHVKCPLCLILTINYMTS